MPLNKVTKENISQFNTLVTLFLIFFDASKKSYNFPEKQHQDFITSIPFPVQNGSSSVKMGIVHFKMGIVQFKMEKLL